MFAQATGHVQVRYLNKNPTQILEVMSMDISTSTIQELFFTQVKKLTLACCGGERNG